MAQQTEVADRGPFTSERVLARLTELADPKILAVNERHGDSHAVNLTKLRALAKEIKPNAELARELWELGGRSGADGPAALTVSAARLVAILISRPKDFSEDELDAMMRDARTPKVHDWLLAYLVQKGPHAEALRRRWEGDPDPVIASAAWELTAHRIAKPPRSLAGGADPEVDLDALLETIEAEMKGAPDRLQWSMNHCLAEIGIHHPELRGRAIAIGERLQVLADYPTPPGCTSPFAPIWIAEMVRRQA